MSDTSPNLSLPYLQPAQAQKHVTHNAALQRLDLLVQAAVEEVGALVPPALPADGAAYALGQGTQNAWAGKDGMLAAWSDGAWLFLAPRPGWRIWDKAKAELRIWSGSAWLLPPPAADNLDHLGINTTADASNRLAVSAPASLFSHEGSDHRMVLNKAASADTASLLFQSDWSGRAEIGLAGADDLSVKVSADGSGWTTALTLRGSDGALLPGAGLQLGGGDAAHRLSLYEQGSYSPALIDMSGNSVPLAPASVSYVRVGALAVLFFGTLAGLDTSGLVAGDAVAVTLPFAAAAEAYAAVELQGLSAAGPFLWHAATGQSHARIRRLDNHAALTVSEIASGVTDLVGGTLTVRTG
ncbi:DUF2793 domain-containing protein [Acidimangrovimonas pyrenivorans]|uniref:DUF2793 domain-containing protein n=1 Tax=Acidimangrovimonas pyrenivorans TaxID=2030798 RepID=A0ABV7ANR8_9RHOB